MWFPITEEIFGSTKNTIWMMNEKNQMALFKPDLVIFVMPIQENIFLWHHFMILTMHLMQKAQQIIYYLTPLTSLNLTRNTKKKQFVSAQSLQTILLTRSSEREPLAY